MNIINKLASLFKSENPFSQSEEQMSSTNTLQVSKDLKDFLENEVLVGLDISVDHFWSSFETIVGEFGPRNSELLKKREDIQSSIDAWHIERRGSEHNHKEYKLFLEEIGYISPRCGDFFIIIEKPFSFSKRRKKFFTREFELKNF